MFNEKTFHSNIKSFLDTHPQFGWVEKLSLASLTDFVLQTTDSLSIKHRKRWLLIENSAHSVSLISAFTPYLQPYRVLGLGSGNGVMSLLQKESPVSVVEKNPFLLLLFLGSFDVRASLDSRQLTFEDAFEVFRSSDFSYSHLHPTLSEIYYDLKQNRLHDSTFDVIMEGELMIDDWNATLRESSIDAYNYPHFMLPAQKIVSDLSVNECSKIWSINRVNGLPKIAAALNKPYLIYEIDPDLSPLIPPDSPSNTTILYTYKPENSTAYQNLGWNSSFLPLAAPRRMARTHDKNYSCELSFVGTSMKKNGEHLLSALKSIANTPEAQLLVDEFHEQQLAAPEDFLAESYHKRWLELGEVEIFAHNGFPALSKKCFYEWSGSVHRIFLVKVTSQFGIQVWGDDSWKNIALESPGITYRGEAGNLFEVPKIYSNSKVNLDITRNYQLDIYTLRVFDALACESLVVTNTHSPIPVFKNILPPSYSTGKELTTLLTEIFSWSDTEYVDRVAELNNEVNSYHRMKHRLSTILEAGINI